MIVKIRKIAILGATIGWCTIGASIHEIACYRLIDDIVRSTSTSRDAIRYLRDERDELEYRVSSLERENKDLRNRIDDKERELTNVKRDIDRELDKIQEDVDQSSTVYGFFRDIYRRIFGGTLGSRLTAMRSITRG